MSAENKSREKEHYFGIYIAYHGIRYESGATRKEKVGVFNACGRDQEEALKNAKRFAEVAYEHHLWQTGIEEIEIR